MRAVLIAMGVTLAAAGAARAEGDPAKGKTVFSKCMACHNADKDQNKVGPTLHGVIGRKAGSVAGFNYSDAMKNSGITWDDASLHEYLENPKGKVAGNKMAFPGLPKPDDRDNVIAYLKEQSAK